MRLAKRRLIGHWTVPLAAAVVVGCGVAADRADAPATATEADAVTYAPTPNPSPKGWSASKVDLLAADAWAQCSFVSDTAALAPTDADMTDGYMASVAASMAQAMGTNAVSFPAWVAFRGNLASYSFQPGETPQAVTLETKIHVPQFAELSGAAGVALRTAVVNYCMAQRLRSAAPGASVLQALSMPLQDQRQLLQLVHERAQIAMLQYALVGQAMTTASRPTGLVARLNLPTEVRTLVEWAKARAAEPKPNVLTGLGKDFAGVVQLDLQITQELAELFAHQAASDEVRAGVSASIADALWGPASWRQRLMGLLYGGDPLVQQASGFVGADTKPGIAVPNAFTTHASTEALFGLDNPSELDWPKKTELPYATVSVNDVHVPILLGIAQSLDRQQQGNAGASPVVALVMGTAGANGCRGTDIQATATRLYSTAEALLETRDCEVKDAQGACTTVSADTVTANLASYQGMVLWKKHRISPAHATTLAMQLDDFVGDACTGTWVDGARVGALDAFGAITTPNGTSLRVLSPDMRFTPRAIEEMAPLFARLARFRMPKVVEWSVPLDQQGLVSSAYFNHAERKRALGTVQAFVATREAVETTAQQNTPVSQQLLTFHKAISDALSAAIGDSDVSVSAHAVAQTTGKPANTFGPDVSPQQPAILTQTVGGQFVPAPPANAAYDWDVDVTVPASDDWWNNGNLQQYKVIAIPNDPHASTFARSPGAMRDGKSLTTLPTTSSTVPTTDLTTTEGGSASRWHFTISLPRTGRYTFLVQKGDVSNTRLLASNVSLASFTETWDGGNAGNVAKHAYYTATQVSSARPLDGQYLAFGGHFGVMAMRTLAPDTADPTQPAFDGFGFPRHFVPAPDPLSLKPNEQGGSNAQPLATYHLNLATQMANQAQDEVNKVLTGLLQQATDDATRGVAARRSKETVAFSKATLCGTPPANMPPIVDPDDPTHTVDFCDTQLDKPTTLDMAGQFVDAIKAKVPGFPNGTKSDGTPICTDAPPDLSIGSLSGNKWLDFVLPPGLPAPPAPVPNADLDKKKDELSLWLDCQTAKLLGSLNVTTSVARAVRIAGGLDPNVTAVPAFDQVNGGTLKSAFVGQFAALKQAQNIVNDMIVQNAATKQHLTSFVAGFQAVQGKAANNCSPGAMASSALAGISAGVSIGFTPSASVSFSPGPMIAQQQKCTDLKGDIDQAAQSAIANMWDTMAALMAQASKLTDASRAIQDSSAQIAQLVNQTKIAASQAQLDEQLTDATLQTSFGLWRTLQNADVAEAQSLLNSARLEALFARRAIESTYVVDMSSMLAKETFVPAPKLWADDVYTMDLDMAALAGVNVGTTTANSVYPYSLKDYVTNLNGFVNGFFQGTRQILPADQQTFVVNLQGPAVIDPTDSVSWSVFCPNKTHTDGTWITVAPAASQDVWMQRLALACTEPVLRVKATFSLDPWGRLGLAAPHALDLSKQYNMRWEKLAVNMLGSSVCDVQPDAGVVVDRPCVSSYELPSTLTQIAPSWTTDYNANWTPLGFGSAELQNVVALSLGAQFQANGWSDPVNGSWVTSTARRGLNDRPMGGMYELELNPGSDPTFDLGHLDGVQILYTASYWQRP